MPRTCTVCRHQDREGIEKATITGAPLRAIARQYSVSKDAVARHRTDHLPAALVYGQSAQERAERLLGFFGNLWDRHEMLSQVTLEILKDAWGRKDQQIVLKAVQTVTGVGREQRGLLELGAKLSGEFERSQPMYPPEMRFIKLPDSVTGPKALLPEGGAQSAGG